MGWCEGSQLAEEVWEAVKPHIAKEHRCHMARKLLKMFEDHDADDFNDDMDIMQYANAKDSEGKKLCNHRDSEGYLTIEYDDDTSELRALYMHCTQCGARGSDKEFKANDVPWVPKK
jgi:hypothetical protein